MSSQWHGGKGSSRRKAADDKAYADNWDRIFGEKETLNPTRVNRVRVTKCDDPKRWYYDHVGAEFDVLGDYDIEYKTRQKDGFINFILKQDCEVV
jgi:hypothetical protein